MPTKKKETRSKTTAKKTEVMTKTETVQKKEAPTKVEAVKKKEAISKTKVKKHIAQVNEYVQTIKELRVNQQLYFDIYDWLKWFDLIMSIVWKEKLFELLALYMKSNDTKTKNCAHFLIFINNEMSEISFLDELKGAYDWITGRYHTIKFSPKAHHFWTEEIYLKDTLHQIQQSLESLGRDGSKNNFMQKGLTFLQIKNSALNLRFKDEDLTRVWFYDHLEEINDEASADNLLPFFHFMNKRMTHLKAMQVRVSAAAHEFMQWVQKDIDELQEKYDAIEAKARKDSWTKIIAFLEDQSICNVSDLKEQIDFSIGDVIRKKDIIQSTITKDIDTLETSLMNLMEII